MDKWPNTLTSVRPFTKLFGHFILLCKYSEKGQILLQMANFGCKMTKNNRLVYITKIMRIASELICIVYVHPKLALTVVYFEFVFSQSTSIGGLKPV